MATQSPPEFVYQPLRRDYHEFRLLDLYPSADRGSPLRCEIRHAPIQGSSYRAISYCWGNQQLDRSELEITYKQTKRQYLKSKLHRKQESVVFRLSLIHI